MASVNKCVVLCKKYNNSTDVLFMMRQDDFRLRDPRFKDNYEVLHPAVACRYNHQRRTLVAGGTTYQVFADWSLRALASAPAA